MKINLPEKFDEENWRKFRWRDRITTPSPNRCEIVKEK
jgi:hypothetical protein